MAHTRISSDSGLPFSAAVVAGGLCFVSGQIGDPKAPLDRQVEQALDRVFAILREAGFSPEELVSAHVALVDMADYGAMNAVYARVFEGLPLPARLAYQVAALPLGARVEIQATAVRA